MENKPSLWTAIKIGVGIQLGQVLMGAIFAVGIVLAFVSYVAFR